GQRHTIRAKELVPGDVVILEAGDRVPADLRIIAQKNARLEEAALTGESEPVEKQVEPVEAEAGVGDRRCMAYSSTVVTSGTIKGVVVATGSTTEIGRIGEMVSTVEQLTTPLLRAINRFGRQLSEAILAISAALFV